MSKVLLVEDSPTQALRVKIALESQGFEVETATSGREAIEMALEAPYDVVLSDVNMPEMDGFELLENFRDDDDLADVPMVLSSATVNADEDRQLALELGAQEYLGKDLSPADLAQTLNKAIADGVS